MLSDTDGLHEGSEERQVNELHDSPEAKAIRRHMRAIEKEVRKLRTRTMRNIKIYVESESNFLIDQDIDGDFGVAERQKAIVAHLGTDALSWTCGAW